MVGVKTSSFTWMILQVPQDEHAVSIKRVKGCAVPAMKEGSATDVVRGGWKFKHRSYYQLAVRMNNPEAQFHKICSYQANKAMRQAHECNRKDYRKAV